MNRLVQSSDGNIAILFAFLLPILMATTGAAIDFWRVNNSKAGLQEIADTAAIAGAREYVLMGKRPNVSNHKSQNSIPENVAKARANQLLDGSSISGVTVVTSSSDTNRSVTVDLEQSIKTSFLTSMFRDSFTVGVKASASSRENASLCVVTLNPSKDNSLLLKDSGILTGAACAIHVNSTATNALGVINSATLTTAGACTSGGYDGPDGNYSPPPTTDCPVREDPLSQRVIPAAGVCSGATTDLKINKTTTLSPDTYCGSIRLNGNAKVTLDPGTYHFIDAELNVSGNAELSGSGVTLVFHGTGSRFMFTGSSLVDLEAPDSGVMAGLLVAQNRNVSDEPVFEIKSKDVDQLVGTIYLPKGKLLIDTNNKVAEASAFTAIIADELWVHKSANLVINSDYEATTVPLPAGLAGSAGMVTLRE